jgi:N,N'-diacetyllegionaminate synthase
MAKFKNKKMKTIIIAEAGVNHNGDVELAKQLISAAKFSGADFVKFQTFTAGNVAIQSAEKADYQKKATDSNERQVNMLHKLELSRLDHEVIINECKRQKISFFSTAFDKDSFDMLYEFGLTHVKIPSGELTNLPFIRHITCRGLPVILSTGMATLGEIEASIEAIEKNGVSRNNITALHCTTEYPAPMSCVNLRAMVNIGKAFGVNVGYSDHTLGIEVPIAAVTLGATIIEKHLTLDRKLSGPDHLASLDPNEFKSMVDAIRNIEVAMGDGVKRPYPVEIKNRLIARRSIVATKSISAGEVFTPENIGTKRPGNGISPMRWDDILGRIATRNFSIDDLIDL